MFLVHMITGPNLLVAISQLERQIGITFEIGRGGNFIQRGQCEYLSANLENEHILAKGRALGDVRLVQAVFAERL